VGFEVDIGIRDETLLSPCMDNNEPLAFGHTVPTMAILSAEVLSSQPSVQN
jgi:hypothetical protein